MDVIQINSGEYIGMRILTIRSIPHISTLSDNNRQQKHIEHYAQDMANLLNEVYQQYKELFKQSGQNTDIALELSSMGIRVDENSLPRQLKLAGCEERAELPYHKAILEKNLPYTIGGGIGQSRIFMFFLQRAHIAEVQSSVWPKEVYDELSNHHVNIF